ncbi:MAG: hypothetical protein MUE73_14340 [Planctomycetes bacterium]|jgi:hypothetical protein|nr:hypothetical protein [Planctomycetota bacterium]
MRRTVPLIITFVAGVFMIATFFFNPDTWPQNAATRVKDWGLILATFAVVLGTGNIIRVSIHKARKGEERFFKIVLLVCLFVTLGLGLFLGSDEEIRSTWLNGGLFSGSFNPFYWIYQHVQLPLGATMFSLLVFYITSAAYRAFRIRSFEAGILLATAVIVMLGQVPISSAIGLDEVMAWIMSVPNVAAKRAIFMGAAMGIAAMSLKIILGIERSYLGGD